MVSKNNVRHSTRYNYCYNERYKVRGRTRPHAGLRGLRAGALFLKASEVCINDVTSA